MSDSESMHDSNSVRKGSAEADKPLESGHDRRSDYEGVLAYRSWDDALQEPSFIGRFVPAI